MPEIQKELIERRTANSKTYDLANGRRQTVVHIGDVHYKDNYTNPSELWKDIDLIWEDNRITKAPYELTHEGSKLTLGNKRTGDIATIELLDIGGKKIPDVAWERSKGLAKTPSIATIEGVALDTDLEVIAEFSAVRFRRILKSDKAPQEAKFKVTGDTGLLVARASDEDGDIFVETSLKDGILTETLKPDRPVKYPVRIDPTLQVGASTDDCRRRLSDDSFSLTIDDNSAGAIDTTYDRYGCGMRFANIAIAQGTTIDAAYLTLRCYAARSGTVCNTRISAEDIDDAATFANDKAAFDARWAARTTAIVDWDSIGAWTKDEDYNSPEIKTVIQEIVSREGWSSGNDIVIFWEDFADRSTHVQDGSVRQAYSYDGSTTYAPKLVIEYTVVDYPISTSCNLSLSASIDRDVAWNRATSSNLSLATSVTRALAYKRATSTAINLTTTISKSWGRLKTISSSLSLATTVSRAVAYTKATSSNLSLAVTVVRTRTSNRAISAALNLITNISKTVAYHRAITVALSIAVRVRWWTVVIALTLKAHAYSLTLWAHSWALKLKEHLYNLTVRRNG